MTVVVRRRHDEPVVPARPAGAAGGARRRRSTRRGSTASRAADGHLPTRPRRRRPRRRRARRRASCSRRAERTAFLELGRSGAARRPTRRSAGRSSCATAASPTRSSCASSGPDRFAVELDGAEVVVQRRAARARRGRRLTIGDAHVRRRVVGCRAASTSSRSTASPTASRATTPASCGRRRPRSSSASTSTPGDVVEAGDRLGVVEAMKMEIGVPAPVAGRVRDVFVARNVQVDAGDAAVPHRAGGAGDDEPRVARRAASGSAARRPAAAPVERARGVPARLRRRRGRRPRRAGDVEARPTSRQMAMLDVFADLAAVAPERRDPGADDERAPREHLQSYLRSLDLEREGLPAWFGDALGTAVAHYGVDVAGPAPALEARCCGSSCRSSGAPSSCRSCWRLLDEIAARADADDLALRESLDRLIERTRRRYPEVAAQARNLRYRRFDRPHVERARGETSARMRSLSAALAGPDRDADARRRARRLPAAARADPRRRTTCSATTPTPGGLIEVLAAPLLQDPRARRRSSTATTASCARRTATTTARSTCWRRASTTTTSAPRWPRSPPAAADVAAPDTAVVDLFLARPAGRRPTPTRSSARSTAARRWRPAGARAARHARRVAPRRRHRRAHVPPPGRVGERPFWMAASDGVRSTRRRSRRT